MIAPLPLAAGVGLGDSNSTFAPKSASTRLHVGKVHDWSARGKHMLFEIWVSVVLLGILSCVSTIFANSRKETRKLDEIVALSAPDRRKKGSCLAPTATGV